MQYHNVSFIPSEVMRISTSRLVPMARSFADSLRSSLVCSTSRLEFRPESVLPFRRWTGHTPGIQISDVQELLDHGATVVVLSRGMAECLHVARETLDFLKERQIAAHVLPTREAVAIYNKLAETEPVRGLFHTTC